METLLNPSLYTRIRIGLPRNVWQGIMNHGIEPDDDVNEAMETVFSSNFYERYRDIINDYHSGAMAITMCQLGVLDYRGIFLASDLVRDIRLKLDKDASQLSISNVLSYLLIRILHDGLEKEYGTSDRKMVDKNETDE